MCQRAIVNKNTQRCKFSVKFRTKLHNNGAQPQGRSQCLSNSSLHSQSMFQYQALFYFHTIFHTYPMLAGFKIGALTLDQRSFSIERHVETENCTVVNGSVLYKLKITSKTQHQPENRHPHAKRWLFVSHRQFRVIDRWWQHSINFLPTKLPTHWCQYIIYVTRSSVIRQ